MKYFLTLLAALCVALVTPARAATYTFTAASSTPSPFGFLQHDWSDAANWSPAGFPVGGPPLDLMFPGLPAGLLMPFPLRATVICPATMPTLHDLTFNASHVYVISLSNCVTWQINGTLTQNGTADTFIHAGSGRLHLINPTLAGSGVGLLTILNPEVVTGPITVTGNHEWRIGANAYCSPGSAPPVLSLTTLTVNGGDFRLLSDVNLPFAGAVNVNPGAILCIKSWTSVPITVTAPSWTVAASGTLKYGTGVSSGPGSITVAGTFAAGCSVATATVGGDLAYTSTGTMEFELGTPGIVGGSDNDLLNITGNLTLDGTLLVLPQAGFGPGTYRLFNYSGTLIDYGVNLGALPTGLSATLHTATPGQVNLIVAQSTACCAGCAPPFPASLTVNVPPGYSYLVNPLCHGADNALGSILANPPDGSQLLKWNKATQTYDDPFTYDSGFGGWVDINFTPVPGPPLPPGEGFIFFNPNPTSFTLTFTGCEPQCPPRCPPTNGLSLVGRTGSATNSVHWEDIFNCPPVCGSFVHIFNGSGFTTYTYLNTGWSPATPTWAAGTSVFVGQTNCPCPLVRAHVLNSGTDASGNLLPSGAAETFWTNVFAPGGSIPMVVINPASRPGVWVDGSTNSRWIGPSTSSVGPAGPYTNRWSFAAPCTNVCLRGRFTSDDDGYLFVNGTLVAGPSGFSTWTSVNVCSGFMTGVNTLEIVVNNRGGGPTGFRTELAIWTECCDPCTSTNLLVNGSFEEGTFTIDGDDCQILPNGSTIMPGWTVTIDQAARCRGGVISGVTASHGTRLIDLTGSDNVVPHAGVTQTVPTATGQCYQLSFDLGVNPQGAGIGGPITVRASAGSSGWRTFTHNPSGPGTQWSTYGFSFTASSASTAITIEGLSANPYFIGLDHVVLTRSCECTNTGCAIAITCPPDITVSNAPGLCLAVVNYPSPTIIESCGANVVVTCTPPSGSSFAVGTNTVICTATNVAGQSVQCTFRVIVRDTQPPQLICDTNELRVPLAAGCQLRIPQIRPAATDNCTAGRMLLCTQNPAAGTLVSGPCATVTITVTDAAGNAAICVRQVCGKDRTPPQLTCPPGSITVSNCQVPSLLGLASATDNCTASNLLRWAQTPPAGTPINVPTRVTITVTDAAGNFATCRTLVTPVGGPCQPCAPAKITRQPVDQRFTVGATVVFSAGAAGTGPLTYQWHRGFAPLSNGGRHSGVNTPLLRVSPLTTADAGRYYCVVSNPCGTATTRAAWLYVWPAHPWPFAEWTFADLGNPFSGEVGAALLFNGNTNQFTVASSEDLGLPDPSGHPVNVLSTLGFTGGSALTLPSIMPSNVTSLANYTVVMDVFVATGASNQTYALFANRPGTNGSFQWTMLSGDPLPTVPGVLGRLTSDGVVMAAPSGQWNRVALVVSTEDGTARVSTYLNGKHSGDTDMGLAGDPIPGIDVSLDQNPGGGIIATPIGGRTNSGNSELHLAGVQFHGLALAPETLASLGRPGAGLSVTELGDQRPGPPLESQAGAGSLMVAWPDRSRLERATQLGSPWLEVLNVVSPYAVPLQGPAGFFRLREEME